MCSEKTDKKLGIMVCSCSGACPSMTKIDFNVLLERIRLELGDEIEFMLMHPRLCEEDGERLMGRILSDDLTVVTAACAVKKQQKLLAEGFSKAGVSMDNGHWIPIVMAQQETNAVFDQIKAAVDEWNSVKDKG